jgi:S1-C subfamily serine protease
MNLLDFVVLVAAFGAALGGWRLGFVARVFAWVGVVIALAIGVHFVPNIVTQFGGTNSDNRVTVALLFLVLLATIGQAVGLATGLFVHRLFPMPVPLPRWDRAAGAAVGFVGVLVLVWMVIPSLATAAGWPARLARGSWVVARIQQFAPSQPAEFSAWGRSISDAPYPSALGPLDSPPNPGKPPPNTISAAVDARVRASVVKIVGRACSEIQSGSGWVAAPGIVVTNAHVVAGERSTSVQDGNGHAHDATVIGFDPVRDLAVLSVPTLDATPLPMAAGSVGDTGAVYGHPGGGALVVSPARVGDEILAVGTDIYRTGSSRRHVYVLAAGLEPGDSGGALVDGRGDVIGVAFAIDPGRSGTSYALTGEEVTPVLQKAEATRAPVGTGGCLVE